jgi:hypothetical protein
MKRFALLALFVSHYAYTQTTGSANTRAECSPANTGNNNVFNVTCVNINPATGKRMLELLNELLQRQIDPQALRQSLDEINDKIPRMKGLLLPASDRDINPGGCPDRPGSLRAVLGTSTVITHPSGQNIIEVGGGQQRVALRRDANGWLAIDADLFDPDGSVLVRIRSNRFVVNQATTFDVQTPDASTLKVSDRRGIEVLDIRFMNPSTVRVNVSLHLASGEAFIINPTGVFYSEAGLKGGLKDAGVFSHNCFEWLTLKFPPLRF